MYIDTTNTNSKVNDVLDKIANSLDISEGYYVKADKRYKAVGVWLCREESTVRGFEPSVYAQGSFRLGTVIKPLSDKDDYDIDLVCELKNLSKSQISQSVFKKNIGMEVRLYAKAQNMNNPVEEGRRCWTMNYADEAQFHLDILPALPDSDSFGVLLKSRNFDSYDAHNKSIAITDRTSPKYESISDDWPRSNPKGFAEWFQERMIVRFDERRSVLAKSLRLNIEEVPDYKIKTPLQKAIQLMKRHRDLMFQKDKDNKPISIIITTLAAKAYDNEADLLETLLKIVINMQSYIEKRGDLYWIGNPVNPFENFADKWSEHPTRKENFFSWLNQLKTDINTVANLEDEEEIGEYLRYKFGVNIVDKIMKSYSDSNQERRLTRRAVYPSGLFQVNHKQIPRWPMSLVNNVFLEGEYKIGEIWKKFQSDNSPLPKKIELRFRALTNVKEYYQVFWQVVNTGEDAIRENGLRGDIFAAGYNGAQGLIHCESTLYKGMHWVECFIVQNGVCVARSKEFVVNIE